MLHDVIHNLQRDREREKEGEKEGEKEEEEVGELLRCWCVCERERERESRKRESARARVCACACVCECAHLTGVTTRTVNSCVHKILRLSGSRRWLGRGHIQTASNVLCMQSHTLPGGTFSSWSSPHFSITFFCSSSLVQIRALQYMCLITSNVLQ